MTDAEKRTAEGIAVANRSTAAQGIPLATPADDAVAHRAAAMIR